MARLALEGPECKVGSLDVSQGCSPDNAACEGFFGRLKLEQFYFSNWQSTTIEQFIEAVDTYFIVTTKNVSRYLCDD